MPCPTNALGQSECAEQLRLVMTNAAAETGQTCEIVVSTLPPIVESPYGENCYECPHGVDYWIEPTGDQVAEWNREGVL